MAVIDIIIIAVLLVFAIVGMVKGFLNTILSLFGTLASIGVAILTARPVAKFLDKIFGIIGAIGGKLSGTITNITPFQSADPYIDTINGTQLKEYISSNNPGFKERVYTLFIEDAKVFTAEGGDYVAADAEVVNYIAQRLAAVITLVIAAVIVFILLKVAVLILSKLFDALTKNRAISGIDRTLGLLFGFAKGALLVCIVLGVFYLISNSTVTGWIDNSTVTKWIYKYVTEFVQMIANKFDLPSFITNLFPVLT